jgi:hypothetical protein
MKKKHKYQQNQTSQEVNDFIEEYASSKKITVFSSFEEEKVYEAMKQANLTYFERLESLEKLRKLVYKEFLNDQGDWNPLVKKITIIEP